VSEAASAVRWLLQQAEPEARRVAVQQIAKVRGRAATELLMRALADDDWRVRKEAAAVAPALEPRDEIVAAVVAALGDRVNIGLRNAAVEALVAIGPDAVGAAIQSLSELDADGRKLAVEVLGGVPDLRGAQALARSLSDEDANVRAAAAEALGGAAMAGEEARDLATRALAEVLRSSDTFLKIAALDSLARLEAKLPWSVFEPYVKDPILRRYAIAGASGSREPAAVAALARATGDESPTISREALIALGEVLASAFDDAPLIERAHHALADTPTGCAAARILARDEEDSRGRSGALLVLGLLRSNDDVAAIAQALEDDDVAERADLALRMFGPAVVPALLAAVRAARPAVRAAALSLAASLEGADPAVLLSALREGVQETWPDVVACAIDGLGRVGEAADLPRVARLLTHPDERVAASANRAVSDLAARNVAAARELLRDSTPAHDPVALGCVLLGAIATTQSLDDGEIRLLERALAHDDPRVRRVAIDALAESGGDAAADAVAFALADEEHEVQLAAARALGRLGRSEALVGVVSDTRDPALAGAALRALGEADPGRALASARPLVTHPDAAIACAAVEAIGQLAVNRASGHATGSMEAEREDALFSALEHSSAEVVKLALSLVGAAPGSRALARLGLCLDHGSWEVRRLAAELLGQDRRAEAEGLLRARFERERDPIVRDAIASAVSLRAPAEVVRTPERATGTGTEGGSQGGE
jgi:HEAT repeat protein